LALLKWPDTMAAAPDGRDAEQLVEQLSRLNWFASPASNKTAAETSIRQFMADLGLGSLSVRWLDKTDIGLFLQDYELSQDPIWASLYGIPQTIRDAAESGGVQEAAAFTMNDVPEHLFHAVYDGAYQAFEEQGRQVILHAVAVALYIASLSASWAFVCDRPNPLSDLLDVMKLGFMPLGVKDGMFYIY